MGWFPLVVLLPTLGAVLTFWWPRRARLLAALFSLATCAFLLWLLARLEGEHRHRVGGWDAPHGIGLSVDGLSMLMLLMTAVVGSLVAVYADGYLAPRQNRYYWPLWLFLWAGLNALYCSRDLFNLYVALELVSFAAVALTALAGKPAVIKAALRYFLVSLAGSLCYLLGVALLYGGFGHLGLDGPAFWSGPLRVLAAAAALMTVGLAMKAALFPLHFWLPPAHAGAAAPVSALLSSLVLKGSFYVLLRIYLQYPNLVDGLNVLMGLGGAAILWGSLQAVRQSRLKLLIAYSTVAQMGYLFLFLPLAVSTDRSAVALAGLALFALSHASAKAAAFLSAGSMQWALGSDRMDSLRGLMQKMPLTAYTLGLAGLSLVGLPPTGGFVAKWVMLSVALEHGQFGVALMLVAGSLLTALYVLRALTPLYRRPHGTLAPRPVPRSLSLSAFALACLSLALGLAGAQVVDLVSLGEGWEHFKR